MAKLIKYKSTKVLEPRDGNDFATTYYQQTHQQRQESLEHIQGVVEAITEVCTRDHDLRDWIQEPLKRFRRVTNKPNYSLLDIVTDLALQLEAGKDIPSGMIGRWNKLFKDTPWDILLEEELTSRATTSRAFNRLFGNE